MVNCCVPFCKSRQGGSLPKEIRFHEFPSGQELREVWLSAISRQGPEKGSRWIPSDYSRVCSLHFRTTDYKENAKVKILKPGVVPSIFPQYPSYLKSKKIKLEKEPVVVRTGTSDNMEEPHIKCEPGGPMGAGETTDYVPNPLSSPAVERLPVVKVEPLPVISDEDDEQETATSIVKEEYEIKDLSFHPPADNQVLVKDDTKPPPSTFEEELDLDSVKKENFGFVSEMMHLKEETEPELAEPVQTQEKSFEPFPEVEVEIFVEERAVGQLALCSKEENSVANVAVSRKGRVRSCHACYKTFDTKKELASHLKTHVDERPYCCAVCSRTFTSKSHLNSHSLSHSGERKHRCNQCGSAFIRKSHLNAHQLSHSAERPFRCNDCGSTFTRKSYLKTHLLAHSGLKPFLCSICNCTFSRKFNLKQHQLCHSREACVPKVLGQSRQHDYCTDSANFRQSPKPGMD